MWSVHDHLSFLGANQDAVKEQTTKSKEEKFSKLRVETKMTAFIKTQKKPDRPPNARIRKIGVNMTAWARKRITISDLRSGTHREEFAAELEARGIQLGDNRNWRDMKRLLKEWHEAKKEDVKTFEPMTPFFVQYLREQSSAQNDDEEE